MQSFKWLTDSGSGKTTNKGGRLVDVCRFILDDVWPWTPWRCTTCLCWASWLTLALEHEVSSHLHHLSHPADTGASSSFGASSSSWPSSCHHDPWWSRYFLQPSAKCKLLFWALWTKDQSWETWCKPVSARSHHKHAHSNLFPVWNPILFKKWCVFGPSSVLAQDFF